MFKRMCTGAVAMAASVVLTSCGASADPPAAAPAGSGTVNVVSHRLVGAAEFATVIAESETLTVNVHVPYEGDIPGTDLLIPFDRVAEQSGRLPNDRDATIAIYCRTGPMSATAAETLKNLGYTDVVELDGGMKAWQASGRPLVDN
ncbi:rhodanese-like domain-containing protein [Mycobacterium sp. URHD0025]|uniref:rhodanese-like domain-containing protein n=1 Tax=Mycobacterium sp. URHD0025 TaxID=1298864 RepID=UPI00048E0DC8|nr:rhodanese-like domain-containing protein [Mycobacterium sp. URHD0025]